MKTQIGLLIFRIVFGLTMLISHGLPKMMAFQTKKDVFPDPLGIGSSLSLGLAILAEVFCAALLTLGLFTRIVAVPLFITMFVAFFIVHGSDPFMKKELAFVYMLGYAALVLTGPGNWSLDVLWRKKS